MMKWYCAVSLDKSVIVKKMYTPQKNEDQRTMSSVIPRSSEIKCPPSSEKVRKCIETVRCETYESSIADIAAA
jgi:hypothetical protein